MFGPWFHEIEAHLSAFAEYILRYYKFHFYLVEHVIHSKVDEMDATTAKANKAK